MSAGERQRVCIARALINDPRAILADEPTGSLDSKNSGVIMDMLKRVNAENGVTILIVTHDDGLSAECGIVVPIRDGKARG